MSDASVSVSDDVLTVVKALKEASLNLPKNANNVETLVQGLRRLQSEEFDQSSGKLKDPKLRRKLTSLWNLVSQLEPQVERARKLTNRRGWKYYFSRAKGKVLGNDITNVASKMQSELQLWLDQQNMEHLMQVLESGQVGEEEKIGALREFEARVKDGYNPELQDLILSTRVFYYLSSLLKAGTGVSVGVQKEAAFALSALVNFNKDVFVSQILMLGVVESLLAMVTDGSDDLSVVAVNVLGGLIAAGKGAVVDEIHAKHGVKKIVMLLEDEYEEMRVAAMECVFEMAYHGRKEVVVVMLELDVVKMLAELQQSEAGGDLIDLPTSITHSIDSSRKDLSSCESTHVFPSDTARDGATNSPDNTGIALHQNDSSECLDKGMDVQLFEDYAGCKNIATSSPPNSRKSSPKSTDSSQGFLEASKARDDSYSVVEEYWQKHPFASAVSRFAIQLEIGQGLRQREKRALKQEIVRRVREAIPSDADAATILAEVLWGP